MPVWSVLCLGMATNTFVLEFSLPPVKRSLKICCAELNVKTLFTRSGLAQSRNEYSFKMATRFWKAHPKVAQRPEYMYPGSSEQSGLDGPCYVCPIDPMPAHKTHHSTGLFLGRPNIVEGYWNEHLPKVYYLSIKLRDLLKKEKRKKNINSISVVFFIFYF
jgi:hypothetical protein